MSWTRSLLGVLGAVAIIALLSYGLTRDPRALPSTMPGQPAPGFQLQRLGASDTIRFSDYAGQVVVLNFWASWCIPCRYEHGELVAAADAFTGRDVRFLGLLYNDRPANALAWLDELGGAAYPSALDDGTRTAIDYGVHGVPETFVIDREGRVRFKKVGPVTFAELRRVIEPLLAGPSATANLHEDTPGS